MGMSIDGTNQRINNICAAILSRHRTARAEQCITLAGLREQCESALFSGKGVELPRWAHERIQGYRNALLDHIYDEEVAFGYLSPEGLIYTANKLALEVDPSVSHKFTPQPLIGKVPEWHRWPCGYFWIRTGEPFTSIMTRDERAKRGLPLDLKV